MKHREVTPGGSGAKVWPARAVHEENKDSRNDRSDGVELLDRSAPQILSLVGTAGVTISLAEAMQNSSTLYGVRETSSLHSK